jgi:hypothetical protein
MRIISAVKRIQFVCDSMPSIILRGPWCDIINLNIHFPTGTKIDYVKDSFYEELEHVFDKFPKNHIQILIGDFNVEASRENIFKLTIGNKSLHETSNDDAGYRALWKNVVIASRNFLKKIRNLLPPYLGTHFTSSGSP